MPLNRRTRSLDPVLRMLTPLALFGAVLALACSDPAGPVEGPIVDGVRLRVLTEELEHPTVIAVVPGGSRMFITERTGGIRVIENGRLLEGRSWT